VSGKDDEIVIVETKYGGRTAPCCRRKGATIFQRASCEDGAPRAAISCAVSISPW
jgi:hypothetical protein